MEGTPKAERDGHERQTQVKPNVQCILLVHSLSFGPFYNVCAHESLQALLAKSVNDWIRPRIFVPRLCCSRNATVFPNFAVTCFICGMDSQLTGEKKVKRHTEMKVPGRKNRVTTVMIFMETVSVIV